MTAGDEAQTIDRPRFLGLGEFGPGNIVYHEGRKHRIASCVVPAGGIEARLMRAKLCLTCGYVHPGNSAAVDLCTHCGTRLDASTMDFPQALFAQPTVRASRWQRISSEEEERAREGYHITTHMRFSTAAPDRVVRLKPPAGEKVILEARFAAQAELWRINHGWRRSQDRNGFVIDLNTGRWQRQDSEDDEDGSGAAGRSLRGQLQPYVNDTRNLLLLRTASDSAEEGFLRTLAYALRRAIQFDFQVEEQEVAVELIGRDEERRILLWEAAEGGIGIWERLIGEPGAIARLARSALELLHYDPNTGKEKAEWTERCPVACYDCLLSYSNQPDHRYLDRRLVREFLLDLTRSTPEPPRGRSYEEQYRWLRERTDPASSYEREVLDFLFAHKLRLPDFAQYTPTADIAVQPDFYYERKPVPGICIFVDGTPHSSEAQIEKDRGAREALRDRGFRVIAIKSDRSIEEQISSHSDVFSFSRVS